MTLQEAPSFSFRRFLIFGVGAFILMHLMFDLDSRCADGTSSSSIGRQGACSHHGGVVRPRMLAFMVSLGIGGVGGLPFLSSPTAMRRAYSALREEAADRRKWREEERRAKTSRVEAPDSVPPCPLHGPMVSNKNATLWVCPVDPDCPYFHARRG